MVLVNFHRLDPESRKPQISPDLDWQLDISKIYLDFDKIF